MKATSPKTICFFNSYKAWGGGEKWHYYAAIEFSKHGYKTIFGTNVVSDLAEKGIQAGIVSFRFPITNLSFLNPFIMWKLVKFFKEQEIHAVVLNLPSDVKAAGIAAKIAGVKHIVYRRGTPHNLRDTILNRFLFRKVLTRVVMISNEVGRSLTEGNESWFPKEKLILMYNGVDTSKIIDHERKMIPRVPGKLMIGTTGRLTDQKGQIYLIEAAKILRDRGEKFVIYIAGEGELRGFLESKIKEFSLEEEVKLVGHVHDIESFLSSIDVFAFPSKYEGTASSLVEVLQFDKPMIAWNISSMPEIVVDGENGFLVDPFNVKDFADKMILADGFKPKINLLREKFDYQKNVSKLLDVFKN